MLSKLTVNSFSTIDGLLIVVGCGGSARLKGLAGVRSGHY